MPKIEHIITITETTDGQCGTFDYIRTSDGATCRGHVSCANNVASVPCLLDCDMTTDGKRRGSWRGNYFLTRRELKPRAFATHVKNYPYVNCCPDDIAAYIEANRKI